MREFLKGWRRKVGIVTLVVACGLAGMWICSHQRNGLQDVVVRRVRDLLSESDGLLLRIPSFAETHSTTIIDRQVIAELCESLRATSCERVPSSMRPGAGGTAIVATPLHGETFALIVSDTWMMFVIGKGSAQERYFCNVEEGSVLKKFADTAQFAYPLLSDVHKDDD
jgi:hypothetical protein